MPYLMNIYTIMSIIVFAARETTKPCLMGVNLMSIKLLWVNVIFIMGTH